MTDEIKLFINEQLESHQSSPEQIAGLLKEEPPEHLEGKQICHESIYQYVYEGEGRYEYLYTHLRRHKKKRKKATTKVSGRQAEVEQEWDSQVKANYAKAEKLAGQAAALF
jgi:IS30 family transposase